MKRILRYVLILIGAGLIGFFLYPYLGIRPAENSEERDSLFVESAYGAEADLDSANQNITASRQTTITRAVQRIAPAVVSVNVLQVKEFTRKSPFYSRDPFLREFFPELFKDQKLRQEIKSMGTGFIISEDGYILTNDHVVGEATEIVVTMNGGRKANAEIIGRDPISDVALLKIDLNNLPYLALGNSDQVILGEWAIAVGNPFGLFEINNRATVTVGVISAMDRDFGEIEGKVYLDMIQTDASINHGNSGGPLCNALGDVIGMNTFIYTADQFNEGSVGIGFAIPINRVKNLLNDLKKYHKIDRNFWIGVRVQNLNDIIAREMDYKGTDGVIIVHIDQGSPAEKAGLKLGDIIVQIGSTVIHSDRDITTAVYETDLRVGDRLKFAFWRDGSKYERTLILESLKADQQ
jgi:serine protease Do